MTTPGAPLDLLAVNAWAGTVATSRTWQTIRPSPAGRSRLALLGITGSGAANQTTAMTDPGGNGWVKLFELYASAPSQAIWHCDGATGGPGGGPTTALGTGANLTVSYPSSSSAYSGVFFDGDLGEFVTLATTTGVVTNLTPGVAGATIIGLISGNPGGSVHTGVWSAPMADMWRSAVGVPPGSNWNNALAAAYGAGGPGVLSVATTNSPTATWRLAALAFAPYVPPVTAHPLKVWDGSAWLDVSAPRASAFDGQDWLRLA